MAKIVPIVVSIQGGGDVEQAIGKMVDAFKKMDEESKKASESASKSREEARKAAKEKADAEKAANQIIQQELRNSMIAAQLYYAAIREGLQWIRAAVADTIMYAARTQELGVVIHSLAKVNAIAANSIDAQEIAIKRLNITTQDTRQTLAKMMIAQLDVSKATELATAAQNLAVVAGVSTQEELERLTHGIITLQPRVLRTAGVFINIKQTVDEYAKSTGRATAELSEQEKQTVILNKVIEFGARAVGLYDAAMETAAKRMRSLERAQAEFQNAFGSLFLDSFLASIKIQEVFYDLLTRYPRTLAVITGAVIALSAAFIFQTTTLIPSMIANLAALAKGLANVVFWMAHTATAMASVQTAVTATAGWLALIALIAAAVYWFKEYEESAKRVVDVDIKMTTTILAQGSAMQKDLAYFSKHKDALMYTEGAYNRLDEMLGQLKRDKADEIRGLQDSESKYQALTKAVGEYTDKLKHDLQPQVQIAAANSIESLRKQTEAAKQLDDINHQKMASEAIVKAGGRNPNGNISLANSPDLQSYIGQFLIPNHLIMVTAQNDVKDLEEKYGKLLDTSRNKTPEYVNGVKLLAQTASQFNMTALEVVRDYAKIRDVGSDYAKQLIDDTANEVKHIQAVADAWKSAEAHNTAYWDAVNEASLRHADMKTNVDTASSLTERLGTSLSTAKTDYANRGFSESDANFSAVNEYRDALFQIDKLLGDISQTQAEYNKRFADLPKDIQNAIKYASVLKANSEAIVTNSEKAAALIHRAKELDAQINKSRLTIAALGSGKDEDNLGTKERLAKTLKVQADNMKEIFNLENELGISLGKIPSDIPSLEKRLFIDKQLDGLKKNILKSTYAEYEAEVKVAEAMVATWSHVVSAQTRAQLAYTEWVQERRNQEQQVTADIQVELKKREDDYRDMNQRIMMSQAKLYATMLKEENKQIQEALDSYTKGQMYAGNAFGDNALIKAGENEIPTTIPDLLTDTNKILSQDIMSALGNLALILQGKPPTLAGDSGKSATYGNAKVGGVNAVNQFAAGNKDAGFLANFAKVTGRSYSDVNELADQKKISEALSLLKSYTDVTNASNAALQSHMEAVDKLNVESRPENLKASIEANRQAAEDARKSRLAVGLPKETASVADTTNRLRNNDPTTMAIVFGESQKNKQEAANKATEQLKILQIEEATNYYNSLVYQQRLTEKFEIVRRESRQQTVDNIKKLEDDLRHVNDNNAEEYKTVWLQAQLEVANGHKNAIKDQIKAQTELSQKTVYDADVVRAKVLTEMARSTKSVNDIMADTFTGTINAIGSTIDTQLTKITSKMGAFGNVIKNLLMDMAKMALNRVFMRILDTILPPSGAANSGVPGAGSGNMGGSGGGIAGASIGIAGTMMNALSSGSHAAIGGGMVEAGGTGFSGQSTLGGIGSQVLNGASSALGGGKGGGILSGVGGILGKLGGIFGGGKGVTSAAGSAASKGMSGMMGGASAALGGAKSATSGLSGIIGTLGGPVGLAISAAMTLGPILLPLLGGLFGGGIEKQIRNAIKSTYQIDVKDAKTLTDIKQIGEQAFGKNQVKNHIQDLIKFPEIQSMLAAYGKNTGQTSSALVKGFDLVNPANAANVFNRIPQFAMGTDYVPNTGLAIVHQGEKITPAGQNNTSATLAKLEATMARFEAKMNIMSAGDVFGIGAEQNPHAATDAVLASTSQDSSRGDKLKTNFGLNRY